GSAVEQICVWIINVGVGRDRLLGCRDVQTGFDQTLGAYDTLTQIGQKTVRATGWAFDGESGDPVRMRVRIEGGTTQTLATNVVRPDVNAVHGRSGVHGFSFDLSLEPGARRVCIVALAIGRGGDLDLGCRQVEVNDLTSVAPGADVSAVQAVGPSSGHALVGIERDAGITTQLRDGSILWFFGDSLETRSDGGIRYFVNNTAAWASAGAPTVTRDGVAPGNVPYQFVSPIAAFPTGCPAGFASVMWPMSATNVPDGVSQRDRVLVFFGNFCLRGSEAKRRGVALVEYLYDPSNPPVDGRMQGTVLRQNLFTTEAEYGTASMVDGGMLHAYECGRPGDDEVGDIWPSDPSYTGCTVARVAPASAADPAAWTYWNGTTWGSTPPSQPVPQPASVMAMPGDGANKQHPVASFSVSNDPHFGYTMTYSPWPGFTNEVYVRTASSPIGPWSAVDRIELPNCYEYATGAYRLCYAGTSQPWRSRAGQIGIGWFDQYIALLPTRGSYLSGNAPL
ncbi:MAG: hypothetical protein ACYC2O_07315, partial [Microthrixaceae bacterium]